MEEKLEEVVEETTQEQVKETTKENVTKVDSKKFKSQEAESNVTKVDLSKPLKPIEENETKEDNADDSGVVASTEDADTPQEQEEVQPEVQAQETPVLEEITEEEVEMKKELMGLEFQYNMQLKGIEVEGVKSREKEKEDRKDERTKIQASQQSEMIDQRNSGKPPKNFESAGNDILGGGFDLGSFDPS